MRVVSGDCIDSWNSRVVITISFVIIPLCGLGGSVGRQRWSRASVTTRVVSGMSLPSLRSTPNERSTSLQTVNQRQATLAI